MLKYKGYYADVKFDAEAEIFHGRVLGMRDVIDFYGRTPAELRTEFRKSVEDYLAWCREEGVKPEKTWSGKLTIRPSETLRRKLVAASAASGESMNNWVVSVLDRETRRVLGSD